MIRTSDLSCQLEPEHRSLESSLGFPGMVEWAKICESKWELHHFDECHLWTCVNLIENTHPRPPVWGKMMRNIWKHDVPRNPLYKIKTSKYIQVSVQLCSASKWLNSFSFRPWFPVSSAPFEPHQGCGKVGFQHSSGHRTCSHCPPSREAKLGVSKHGVIPCNIPIIKFWPQDLQSLPTEPRGKAGRV